MVPIISLKKYSPRCKPVFKVIVLGLEIAIFLHFLNFFSWRISEEEESTSGGDSGMEGIHSEEGGEKNASKEGGIGVEEDEP